MGPDPSVVQWLKEAGIAKSPSSESVKKVMQEVLDREREEEERRLLNGLPIWIKNELEPGVAALTSHLQLMVAKVHEQTQQAENRSREEAEGWIRLRDRQIGRLEEQLVDQGDQLEKCTQDLEEAIRRAEEYAVEVEELRMKNIELKSANSALERAFQTLSMSPSA